VSNNICLLFEVHVSCLFCYDSVLSSHLFFCFLSRCRWKLVRRWHASCCPSWWCSSSAGCRVTSGTSGTTSTPPSTTCSGMSSRSSPTVCRSSTPASIRSPCTFSVASSVATTTATCSAAAAVTRRPEIPAEPPWSPPGRLVVAAHRAPTPRPRHGPTSACRWRSSTQVQRQQDVNTPLQPNIQENTPRWPSLRCQTPPADFTLSSAQLVRQGHLGYTQKVSK